MSKNTCVQKPVLKSDAEARRIGIVCAAKDSLARLSIFDVLADWLSGVY
jgi:hypothetical protein